MKRYVLTREAEEDLGDIRAYFLARTSSRTTRFVMGEISKAMQFLAGAPGAGHLREDLTDDRVKFWPVFSFLIIYDPTAEPIGIVRVLHASQDIKILLQKKPPRA